MNHADTSAAFLTTQWSLVGALRDGDPADRNRAMGALYRCYWPPVYAFLRRSGFSQDHAEELTEDFFATVVVHRALFARADPALGKLRTFIRRAVTRYAVDRNRRREARGGKSNVSLESIEREEALIAQLPGTDPADVFDRRWQHAVLEEAVRRTRQQYLDSGMADHWAAFEARHLRPAIGPISQVSHAALAITLGRKCAADVGSMVQQVRRHIDARLREVVAETVTDADQVEEEVKRLKIGDVGSG
jgi:DNA-directed RNA polymerase specialized sigma24 family protein